MFTYPILLYALEVCNLNKSTMQSLDFSLNRFFIKLFRTSNMEIVTYCQEFFSMWFTQCDTDIAEALREIYWLNAHNRNC